VGTAEIAAMLINRDGESVSRQYVDRLSREDPTFPAPEVQLASGRVWAREAIVKWAEKTGRPIQ
jgi:hypothetical protein